MKYKKPRKGEKQNFNKIKQTRLCRKASGTTTTMQTGRRSKLSYEKPEPKYNALKKMKQQQQLVEKYGYVYWCGLNKL